jgi:hypothetical protein
MLSGMKTLERKDAEGQPQDHESFQPQFREVGDEAWQSSGYDHATDAYQVEVNGGSSTITMDTSNAQ